MSGALLAGFAWPAVGQSAQRDAFSRTRRQRTDHPAPDDAAQVLRNQSDIRATLDDLRTDVQVTQAKVDELTVQFARVLAELEQLRAAMAGARAEPAFGEPAPAGSTGTLPTLARSGEPRSPRPRAEPPEVGMRAPERATRVGVARPAPPASPAAPVPPAPPAPVPPAPPVVASAPPRAAQPAGRGEALQPAPLSPDEQFGLYESALNAYHSQDYATARQAFADFLDRFGESAYANNAQFYIGQCYYAEGKYGEAVAAYQLVVDRYPRGTKVPSALLKIGYARQKIGQLAEAKRALEQVVETYPYSSEAQLARARLERL